METGETNKVAQISAKLIEPGWKRLITKDDINYLIKKIQKLEHALDDADRLLEWAPGEEYDRGYIEGATDAKAELWYG